jgi:hypothetical protein
MHASYKADPELHTAYALMVSFIATIVTCTPTSSTALHPLITSQAENVNCQGEPARGEYTVKVW